MQTKFKYFFSDNWNFFLLDDKETFTYSYLHISRVNNFLFYSKCQST